MAVVYSLSDNSVNCKELLKKGLVDFNIFTLNIIHQKEVNVQLSKIHSEKKRGHNREIRS